MVGKAPALSSEQTKPFKNPEDREGYPEMVLKISPLIRAFPESLSILASQEAIKTATDFGMVWAKIKTAQNVQNAENVGCPEGVMKLQPGFAPGVGFIAVRFEELIA